MRAALIASLLGALPSGCGDPEEGPPPGPIEIGINVGGAFQRIADGELMPVTTGANGLDMVTPCFRSPDINPTAPDPEVTVTIAGKVMGAEFEGDRPDMAPGPDGWVLWDLRVPFQVHLCCFPCQVGLVEASVKDADGRVFAGSVTVELGRMECPDEDECCFDESMCDDLSMAQICPPA